MACEPKQSGYSGAGHSAAKRIFPVYYNLGLIFVVLVIGYDHIVLTKVSAKIWEHVDNKV